MTMTNTEKTITDQLIERMLSFDENANFDGYPSMSCSDDSLIFESTKLTNANVTDDSHHCGEIVHLCFLASEHCKTQEHLINARRFIQDFVDVCWDCNMSEGSNEAYEAQNEAYLAGARS